MKGFLSWQQRPSKSLASCVASGATENQEHCQVCSASRWGPRTHFIEIISLLWDNRYSRKVIAIDKLTIGLSLSWKILSVSRLVTHHSWEKKKGSSASFKLKKSQFSRSSMCCGIDVDWEKFLAATHARAKATFLLLNPIITSKNRCPHPSHDCVSQESTSMKKNV